MSYLLKLEEIDLKRLGFVEIWDIFRESFRLGFLKLIWEFCDLLERDNNIYIFRNPSCLELVKLVDRFNLNHEIS
jgi:hypothetical protein